METKYRIYGKGKIAGIPTDEPLSPWREITMTEITGNVLDVDKDPVEFETIKTTNADGSKKTIQTIKNPNIKARWTRLGESNRLTPPNVGLGASVVVYTYADSQDYFWTSDSVDISQRTKEKVVYGFSNKNEPDEPTASINLGKIYKLVIDTYEKISGYYTSRSDGEKAAYHIQIDGKEGELTVGDDSGNEITIQSVDGEMVIEAKNKIKIITKEANISCDECVVDAKNKIGMKSSIIKLN